MKQTQYERKAETRDRLLVAAAALFADHGVDGVSVDAVATAANRTSGAIYAHFGSKQGLLLAVLDTWRQSINAVLSADVARETDKAEQLAAVWRNVSDHHRSGSGDWTLLEHELWLRAARDEEVADALRARNANGRRNSARELGRWSRSVNASPIGNSSETTILITALLTGLAMQQRLEPDTVPVDLAVRGLSALLGVVPHQSGELPISQELTAVASKSKKKVGASR